MKIAVIGLGKIGLPLAAQFADQGHQVTGVDINPDTVLTVNDGTEPFPGEAHLDELLGRLVPAGNLTATTTYSSAIPDADAVVVVVPLVVDSDGVPDFEWMDAATHEVAVNLSTGTLVVYETTLPVGTTRNRWKPMLEERSGLIEGTDFYVVFSPERVLTGRVFEDLRRYPKLIGALNSVGAMRATEFYRHVLDFDERPDLERGNGVWDLGSAEAAEMAKLAETTYRDVNIALANQFARFAAQNGIDVHQVIEASNSQPYSHIHKPGIAVGGHCIPIYPRFYLHNDPNATVVRAARETNAAMPEYAVGVLAREFGDLTNARVVVLGASYRGGVKETAFSGVFPTVAALHARGAEVTVHDPLYDDEELGRFGFVPYRLGDPVDAAVLQTDHLDYSGLTAEALAGVRVIVDGRRILDPGGFPEARVIHLGTSNVQGSGHGQ